MWVPGACGAASGGTGPCPPDMPAAIPLMRCKWVPDPAAVRVVRVEDVEDVDLDDVCEASAIDLDDEPPANEPPDEKPPGWTLE